MTLDIRGLSANQLIDREKGLVSRDIFVDEELYVIEKERVFARCWLVVGFEDQVKKPGDYFVSRMGEESVILSRDRDNTVHVFLNSCRHRGMKVCRYDEGNTPVFTCPYHGWSYAGDGSLVGVPRYKDAYREELDKSQWGLVEVAQMENYKGTIWATWDPKAPPFLEYIGDNEPGLSLWMAKPDGSDPEFEVMGVLKWLFSSNWKFGSENFLGDNYHGTTTHHSVQLVGINPGGGQGRSNANLQVMFNKSSRFDLSHHGSGRLSQSITPGDVDVPYAPAWGNRPNVETYYREAYERRKQLMGKHWRLRAGNGNIFPNATQGTHMSMCVWNPAGADWTECWRFYYVHRDMPQEVKDVLRHYYMRYGGPSGLTEEDDMENWNYAHKASKGVIARRYPYDYSMGMSRVRRGHPMFKEFGLPENAMLTEYEPGKMQPSEQNQRGAYYFWADLMDAEGWDDLREKGVWP